MIPRYSAFSRLVDCALDEAAQGFEDRSVDLLHIRMHADAALGHLFDRWRPKLSDRAVLLLHGISARERGTGAWQFWDEIARRFPHFAFLHSHGLGIAGIGGSLPESAGVLLGLSEPKSVAVRSVFASLGERLVRAEELRRRADAAEARAVEVAPLECHVRELEVRLAAAAAAAEALEKELASRTQESRALKGAEELLQGSCIVLQKELEGRAEDCERLTVTVAELNREVAQLNGEVAQLNGEIAEFAAERAALTERVESLDQHYHAMANSASWRLTRPLRGARMTMRSLGGRLRRRRAPAGDGQ